MFKKNIYGRTPDISKYNKNHSGAEGHWLELQFGKKPDNKTEPDFYGYELKNDTSSKTTWGDWTPNYAIFEDNKFKLTRKEFIHIFGKSNPNKNHRYSWSGSHVPTRNGDMTYFGQCLSIDENNDINIYYNFKKDQRENKNRIVPLNMQISNLLLFRWIGYKKNNFSKKLSLEERVNKKFGNKGWFRCKKINGVYAKIEFGNAIDFEEWVYQAQRGNIYFDSGMKDGNSRPYSVWRSDNKFWDKLVIESY